ncbi:bifunctional methylenetetrahydrofolate dehydrogenase/methenyltetrahydrofolate cyclohydrolase FolD [Erythrobacter arachoides]|uniref:Bifunctional protein FolD n=1 Tax=Aurantiacibacter arachoides TaxID=1850444 RepID=A0A845A220_9SPHN|nr:bifunctional methylenetetrahydrofolate dehydrogenase/methenyltetrahydrofolate cyclohydrolase FolD [Aurantiacibacter arachoides]MXO94185.1 bifunctional methylenetetrahydrofolate dehydrogenase/methenyltetrahydrofolate cyclohydrolase FolD [Aurantiacibacter arachoides]GGD65438.1 bifunctional protein FolD [Aurantiacibacter arachoides]
MAETIDGRAVARALDERTRAMVDSLVAEGNARPGLAVVLVGNDPASEVYVSHKTKACERLGLASFEHRLPAETSEADLLVLIADLNARVDVHGVLVQVPLPDHIDEARVLEAIDPAKDVDGFHPVNVGRISAGTGGIRPCTAAGVVMLIKAVEPELAGFDALVIGRSNIVGKPVATLLTQEGCTVTLAHSQTRDLPEKCRRADIVVAAVGRPELVRGDWVRDGAIVIDVGISRSENADGKGQLVGDVAFAEMQHARAVTPVPGGVGPMTIAVLLHNTVEAAKAFAGGKSAGMEQGQ